MSGLWPPSWSPLYDAAAVDAVAEQLRVLGVDVVADQPLGPWTTLGVGGAARQYLAVPDRAALGVVMAVLATTSPADVPLLVVGKGSNLLVADGGWPGLAVRLGRGFTAIRRDGDLVEAGAAAAMPALATWAAEQGLAGLEFAAGIPASVGGSVRMNAGAHGQEVADRLVSVEVFSPADPAGRRIESAALQFAYRHSTLPDRGVVAVAEWRLPTGDIAAILGELDELRSWRRRTQPIRQRNCGSVFTNPGGDSAGRIVDAAGLKGLRVGGARVSEKHANFIVVDPGVATARDVVELIALVREKVHAAGGPLLEPEVRLVGDFGGPP